jgi:hypothetical protein
MIAIQRTMTAIPEAGRATDRFLVCDLPGLADFTRREVTRTWSGAWYGDKDKATTLDCIERGDLSGVAVSDNYLRDMESHVIVSRKYRTVDDVVGSTPNVVNYLAGLPCAMRRRIKTTSATAPLAVVVDLTSSASIGAKALRKRGAAVLALVRLLSNLRPVELWTLTGTGERGIACYAICRMETAPLDLARVAYAMTDPSFARGACYSAARVGTDKFCGSWPYGEGPDVMRKNAAKIFGRVISPGSEVLFVPAIHRHDKAVTDPVAWLKGMLATYGGQTVQA